MIEDHWCQPLPLSLVEHACPFGVGLTNAPRCDGGTALRRQRPVVEDRARHVLVGRRSALTERALSATSPAFEVDRHCFLDGVSLQQVHRVHAPALSNPIDAADSLLEPQRIPRQFEIDHQPATVM